MYKKYSLKYVNIVLHILILNIVISQNNGCSGTHSIKFEILHCFQVWTRTQKWHLRHRCIRDDNDYKYPKHVCFWKRKTYLFYFFKYLYIEYVNFSESFDVQQFCQIFIRNKIQRKWRFILYNVWKNQIRRIFQLYHAHTHTYIHTHTQTQIHTRRDINLE